MITICLLFFGRILPNANPVDRVYGNKPLESFQFYWFERDEQLDQSSFESSVDFNQQTTRVGPPINTFFFKQKGEPFELDDAW